MPTISQLFPYLAKGWEQKCLELKIIERRRGIKTPEDLMLLNLFHLVNGCSLMEISEAGRLLKIGKFSDVAFMNRFEQCGEWFAWNCEQFSRQVLAQYLKPPYLNKYRVIAFDASDIVEKGRSGQCYRLHYGIDIFNMNTVSYKITKSKVGETLCNFQLQQGDLAICDRAYGTVNGIVHCVKSGADFILRLRTNAFKIYDSNGEAVDIVSKFQKLKTDECGDFQGFVRTTDGTVPVRICAKRKTDADYEKTVKKLKRRESRRMCKTTDETMLFNRFIVVVTSLPPEVSAFDVLETYRYRWQIEIYFKRLKSIMDLGDLPKKREKSSLAWINGKIMVALMIESFLSSIAFSPGDAQSS